MSQPGNDAAKSHPITDWGKSLTRQSELKYADINLIMRKYEKTGVLPPATRQGFFADVSGVGDYREAVERVDQMAEYFAHVPADIKKRFDNDPAEFLDFVTNPANMAEIEAMGLIAKSEDEVPPVKEPAAAPDRVGPATESPAGD